MHHFNDDNPFFTTKKPRTPTSYATSTSNQNSSYSKYSIGKISPMSGFSDFSSGKTSPMGAPPPPSGYQGGHRMNYQGSGSHGKCSPFSKSSPSGLSGLKEQVLGAHFQGTDKLTAEAITEHSLHQAQLEMKQLQEAATDPSKGGTQDEELHMALKSCTEIGSAKTLYQLVWEVHNLSAEIQKENPQAILIPHPDIMRLISNTRGTKTACTGLNRGISSKFTRFGERKFIDFLKSVIVCTEGLTIRGIKDTDLPMATRNLPAFMRYEKMCVKGSEGRLVYTKFDEQLERLHMLDLIRRGFYLKFEKKYLDLLSSVVKNLLYEKKKQHLQTFGYSLEELQQTSFNNQFDNVIFPGQSPSSIMDRFQEKYVLQQSHINMNKQCMVTREMEMVYQMLGDNIFTHFYSNYMIFLKAREGAMVQIAGCNIFYYLNDRLGRQNNTQYSPYANQKVNLQKAKQLYRDLKDKQRILAPELFKKKEKPPSVVTFAGGTEVSGTWQGATCMDMTVDEDSFSFNAQNDSSTSSKPTSFVASPFPSTTTSITGSAPPTATSSTITSATPSGMTSSKPSPTSAPAEARDEYANYADYVGADSAPTEPTSAVVARAISMGNGCKVNQKSHKYNLKTSQDSYLKNQNKGYWEEIINRNRLFYCTHQNRANRFFNKHILNDRSKSLSEKTETIFEAALGFVRIRRQLKDNVLKILRHFIDKQMKIDYGYYLNKYCPLPYLWETEIKEQIKEAEKDSSKRPAVYRLLFEESSTSLDDVAKMMEDVLANLLPKEFVAVSSKNKKVFNRKLAMFIKYNRFESFSRITLLEQFQIHNLPWLRFSSKHKNAKFFQRENEFVFFGIIRWLFEEYVIGILRCFFYVTEKQKQYSWIYYYRKNIWNVIMKLSILDLQKDTLEFVEKHQMQAYCESNQYAPGKLRLIPKGETFRPIMTFNRKIPGSKSMTTNKKLGISHMMLKNLKTKMFQKDFGFAVFNYDDIMKKYEVFVQRWKQMGKPKLYFVTMDIEKCYDNVDASKVVQFLQKTDLLEKEYFFLSCIVLKRKNNVMVESKTFKKQPLKNYFRHKYHKIGVDGGQYPSLFDILNEENDLNFKKTLIVEEERRKKHLKQDLLAPIEKFAKNNYITFNKRQYKQVRGIPQGMCLSYILSSFYYANLEENALHFLKEKNDLQTELNLLMRLTDDYLLITTNKNNAILVIEQLQKLSQTNLFKMNMKKLKTNFLVNLAKMGCHLQHQAALAIGQYFKDLQPQNIDVDYCSWIGISIHMDTLEITPNQNLRKEGILCTLNVNMQTDQSVQWLKRKLKSFLMNNISFYFKATINSMNHAIITLNKLCQLAAEKMITCCHDFRQYHLSRGVFPMAQVKLHREKGLVTYEVDLRIAQIVYVVIRSFFKYLVCNVKGSIFNPKDHLRFFRYCLQFFIDRFQLHSNEFAAVYKILQAKQKKLSDPEEIRKIESKFAGTLEGKPREMED